MSYNKLQLLNLEWTDGDATNCGITDDNAIVVGKALFGEDNYTVAKKDVACSSSITVSDANLVYNSETKLGICFIKTAATGATFTMIPVINGEVATYWGKQSSVVGYCAPNAYTTTIAQIFYIKSVDDYVCITSARGSSYDFWITDEAIVYFYGSSHNGSCALFSKTFGDAGALYHGNSYTPIRTSNSSTENTVLVKGLIENYAIDTELYFIVLSPTLPNTSYFSIGNDVYWQVGASSSYACPCFKVGTIGD